MQKFPNLQYIKMYIMRITFFAQNHKSTKKMRQIPMMSDTC